jgi:hypothetical protein
LPLHDFALSFDFGHSGRIALGSTALTFSDSVTRGVAIAISFPLAIALPFAAAESHAASPDDAGAYQ